MHIFGNINSIKRIGQDRHKFDIIYNVNGEKIMRGLQVKTLTESKGKGAYYFKIHKNNCPNNTLFVGINKKKLNL